VPPAPTTAAAKEVMINSFHRILVPGSFDSDPTRAHSEHLEIVKSEKAESAPRIIKAVASDKQRVTSKDMKGL
jgi:hypothetical protein